jgi:RNA polymerase sigma-70 factor (sigma-E family)
VIIQPVGRSDDVGSLEAAYDANYLALLRMAVLLTDDQGQAEDLVQEAFIRSAARLEGLPRDEAKPYLRAAILNLWRNRLRHLAVERRHASAVEGPGETPGFEERMAMWQVVATLPPRQRACLVLRFYEDLPVERTAQLLGCSQGTVKSQTSRAIERLRQEWKP